MRSLDGTRNVRIVSKNSIEALRNLTEGILYLADQDIFRDS
jgi:hypothetical protein